MLPTEARPAVRLDEDLSAIAQDWQAAARSTAPANRQRAEAGARAAYRAVGLTEPAEVIWCKGPRDLTDLRTDPAFQAIAGGMVVNRVIQPLRVLDTMAKGLITRRLQERLRRTESSATRDSRSALIEALRRDPYLARSQRGFLKRLLDWLTGPDIRFPAGDLADFGVTQHHATKFTIYSLAEAAFPDQFCGNDLQGLADIVRNAGMFLPFEHAAILVERHDTFALDDIGRLHRSDGPAIAYPDGWRHFAWKGVGLSPWIIEQPGEISLTTIEREFDMAVRHCMVDIMTAEKFIRECHAYRVGEDECGVLWRHAWRLGGSWCAVEVVNGTPESDGTFKHYYLQVPPDMRTPGQAVAWTYGMRQSQYRYLTART